MHARQLLLLALLATPAFACDTTLPVNGTLTIEPCEGSCLPALMLMGEYSSARPDVATGYSLALHTSPWRIYGEDLRIQTVQELADEIRATREPQVVSIELYGSWTGVAPSASTPSLAARVSQALGGFPVTGMDGFLWLQKDGGHRTSRQATTDWQGELMYEVPAGGDILEPLAFQGWTVGLEELGDEEPKAELLLRAGIGWDALHLCPDKALSSFEAAAAKGSAIGAYNAALVRLDRGQPQDRDAAIELLKQAAALGDAKAATQLAKLQG